MIKIGLTGSIGMGKSTVAAMFADMEVPTWSADDAVHRLYAEGGAGVAPIAELFPGAIDEHCVDRTRLAAIVLGEPEKLRALEAVIHPLVEKDRNAFLSQAEREGAQAALCDIPLLFEGQRERVFDVVIVVSADAETQRDRVLARPGMTEEKFNAIMRQQLSDAEKRARADFVIQTNQPLEDTRAQARRTLDAILANP